MELTLFHYWRSSSSWRVRWALTLKGAPYQSVAVDLLKDEQKAEAMRRLNPMGQVPCLIVDGAPVAESMAIIELLDELLPTPPLLPTEPLARARARQLAEIINSATQPLQNLEVMRHVSSDKEAQAEWNRHWIVRGLTAFEQACAPSAGLFTLGDQLTLPDLFLVPQCYNALRNGLELARWPRIQGIYERCLALPSCDQAAPHNQPGAR